MATLDILTADQIMRLGLLQVGFSEARQESASRKTNIERFTAFYGSSPLVCAQIWEDLLTTDLEEARIDTEEARGSGVCFTHFLMTMYFFKIYPTMMQIQGPFDYGLPRLSSPISRIYLGSVSQSHLPRSETDKWYKYQSGREEKTRPWNY
jgi:hypothetical protein